MCPAVKKITETIADDMRAKYGTGEATQAELADLFHVSIPTVNKTVKGIKPQKRKYRVNPQKAERDAAIVAEFDPANGVGMKELAAKYDMTHQNVSLILKSNGIKPQQDYFEKLKEKSAARKERLETEKKAHQEAKEAALEKLSQMWKDGCTIDEFRQEAGLKSTNAAQVKIVHLRKKYGDEKFPRRNSSAHSTDADYGQKVAELSKLYLQDPTDLTALAAVFGEKESSVSRRIHLLRKNMENGETMFPRRRKARKSQASEVAEEEKEGGVATEVEKVEEMEFVADNEVMEAE